MDQVDLDLRSERDEARTAMPNSYYRQFGSPESIAQAGAGAAPGSKVKANEDWDGGALAVIPLFGPAYPFDVTVYVMGGGARPYIKSGDVLDYVLVDGLGYVFVDSDGMVGETRNVWIDVALIASSGAAAVTSGRYIWWRKCDGGSVNVSNPPAAGSLNGVTVPNLCKCVTPGYDAVDADYNGTDVSGRPNSTGGNKTHNGVGDAEGHDDHTLADHVFLVNDHTDDVDSTGTTTITAGDLTHDHTLSSIATAASGSGVNVPTSVDAASVPAGDLPLPTNVTTTLSLQHSYDGSNALTHADLAHTVVDHRDPYYALLKIIKVA